MDSSGVSIFRENLVFKGPFRDLSFYKNAI